MNTNSYQIYETESEQATGKLHITQSIVVELLLMAGVLGVLFCFLSDNIGRMVLLAAAFLSVLYMNLIRRWKPDLDILRMVPIAVGILALVINPVGASRGLLFFCNQWISLWDNRFNQLVPQLQVADASVMARVQVLLFLLLLLSVWVDHKVNKRHLIRISIFVVCTILLTAVFQMNMGMVWVVCLITGWLLAWLSTVSIHFWSMKQVPIGIVGLLVIGLLGFLFVNYSGNKTTEGIKSSFLKSVDQTRFGSDTLPEGDMSQAKNMVGSTSEGTLQLTTANATEMYLKGFVGGAFNGSSWDTLGYSDYTDEEIAMMQWLQDQSFESSYTYDNYTTYTGGKDTNSETAVSVENVGANRKYVYLPYELQELTSGRASMYRDYQLKSRGIFGTSAYAFRMFDTNQPTETIVQKNFDTSIDGAEAYSQEENVYASYVKSNYLDLTDEQKQELDQTFFAEGDWANATLYQVTEQIRTVMQENTTYMDNPPSYSGNNDFVDWFMNTAKGGNSAYYATVATLAYRAAGIPARYVEGYYLSDSAATQYKEAGQTDITLSAADAHAWTEVYLDGVGWMPVEVVPGFYYAEYTTQQIVGTPQSTVNIMNQSDENQLQGSTTDTLESSGNDDSKSDIPPVERVIRVVGILLLIALILWFLQFLIMARYRIMRSVYEGKLKGTDHESASRMLYRHTCKVLKQAKVPVKEEFPYENIPLIREKYPKMDEYECKRFAQLLQKVVFGQQELNDAEYHTVEVFDEKISKEVYKGLDKKGQLLMKLGRALV